MNGLGGLFLAASLVFGGHELGHQVEADAQNVPMTWSAGPQWYAHTGDDEELSRIAGAGFRWQGLVVEGAEGTAIEKEVRALSALNKIGYALLPGGIGYGKEAGDVRTINRVKGDNVTRAALVGSAVADLYQRGTVRVEFWQHETGTPGLQLIGRW